MSRMRGGRSIEVAMGILVGLGSVVGRSPSQRRRAEGGYKDSQTCIWSASTVSVEHDDDDPASQPRDLPP